MTRRSDINPSTIHVPGLRPRSGWIVKSAVEDAWSGPGVGDPDNPALGHECVYSESEAHVFDDEDEAIEESWTYNCGADVLRVGENGGDRGLREEGCGVVARKGRKHSALRPE